MLDLQRSTSTRGVGTLSKDQAYSMKEGVELNSIKTQLEPNLKLNQTIKSEVNKMYVYVSLRDKIIININAPTCGPEAQNRPDKHGPVDKA
ncbi:hypothetical protein QJS04_geneDACA002623 [Acorus gramineus]|uniref:Uncharacterized protein n=1 Tax=Acorus gramineus TaxID=55184 RepID=A0AAV9AR50_ACOGR|nr:hypothetical protein QJS04_geneDACA002623 [Acorus gramineus]